MKFCFATFKIGSGWRQSLRHSHTGFRADVYFTWELAPCNTNRTLTQKWQKLVQMRDKPHASSSYHHLWGEHADWCNGHTVTHTQMQERDCVLSACNISQMSHHGHATHQHQYPHVYILQLLSRHERHVSWCCICSEFRKLSHSLLGRCLRPGTSLVGSWTFCCSISNWTS